MWKLYEYQAAGVDAIACNFANGIRRQLLQCPTGGGKTVLFSGLTKRYLDKFNKSVVILVHREELLRQTRNTLFNGFELMSEPVTAKKRTITPSLCYVGMVETVYNRLKKRPRYFGNVGMVIVDECHIGNFNKIYDFFPDSLIVGFSATPIATSKKDPLKNYFDELVQGPQITELIHLGKLSPNETYSIKGINRNDLKVKRGEFDSSQMGEMYSNSRNVHNTVEAFKRLGNGLKTMVFNCNVEHSKLVNQAFLDAGYNSRHIDGTSTDRKNTLTWFKNTPDAILNNIGVLTTGFDEPSVMNVIINRSTMSLPLWLQMTGRGGRIYPGKDYFRIIDMGGNAIKHGDWRIDRDWNQIFHHPEKPYDGNGVAPIKACEGCEAIIPAQARTCAFCGHVHERVIEYDTIAPEFEMLVGSIKVESLVNDVEDKGQKEWKVFFDILKKTIQMLKYQTNGLIITESVEDQSYVQFMKKVKEWCNLVKKPYSKYVRDFAKEKFTEEIDKIKQLTAA